MSPQPHSFLKALVVPKAEHDDFRPVNTFALHEPSVNQLGSDMQWLKNKLLEGAASKPGEPFSKEYFQKLLNRRKTKREF